MLPITGSLEMLAERLPVCSRGLEHRRSLEQKGETLRVQHRASHWRALPEEAPSRRDVCSQQPPRVPLSKSPSPLIGCAQQSQKSSPRHHAPVRVAVNLQNSRGLVSRQPPLLFASCH